MNDAHKFIVNLSMPEKVTLFKELYNELAGQGIEGDTELAHVNTFEASLLKSIGGSGTINEITGLREYKGGGSPPPPAAPAQQTVTQTSEFPTELKPFISDVLGEAKGEFGREKAEGYLPFQGPQLAAFTPEQQQAFATGREQFGAQGLAGTPLGQASTYYQPALAATALGTAEIGAEDIGRRMDPFLQNVVDIAQREAVRNEEEARQQRAARAIAGQGFLGGTRPAFVESQAAESLQERLADIQAQGLSSAFQNAQRAAEAQRAREMAGGRQFAGLGESAFQRARGDITGLAGVGEAQQARSQQALDIARRQFEEEKAFPQTALQRYASIIRGFPLTPSQQIVTAAPPIPTPSLAQTMLGAAGTGVGLYGAFGGFKKAGGLVGLLGGGTPMNPLRPPYNLFSGPSSRVDVPQYQGGGPIVSGPVGSGFASGAVGGPNTSFTPPASTAPSATDLNSIIEELRRRKLIGRSAGGLAGLTVSRHQAGEEVGTDVFSLSDLIPAYSDIPLTTDWFKRLGGNIKDIVQTEGVGFDIVGSDIQPPDDKPNLVERGLTSFDEFMERDRERWRQKRLQQMADELGPMDMATVEPETGPVVIEEDTTLEEAPAIASSVDDPVDDLAARGSLGIPEAPEDYDTSAWEAAQTDYLDALKAATEGGDQDKWLALANWGRRIMAETPKEGENILNIAARTGEKPLAALQQSMKEDKALRLNYLKENVDIEAQRANLKSAKAEKKFDNALKRFMAGIALTEAEYKILGLRYPKGDAVTLTASEIESYPDLFEPYFDKILDDANIAGSAAAYAKNKDLQGATAEEALRSGIKRLKGKDSKKLMQRVEEIMGLQRQKNKTEAIDRALAEWLDEGGTFKRSGFLERMLPRQSTGTFYPD